LKIYISQGSVSMQLDIVAYLVTNLLQIIHIICRWKNFENRPIFGCGLLFWAPCTCNQPAWLDCQSWIGTELPVCLGWKTLKRTGPVLSGPCIFQSTVITSVCHDRYNTTMHHALPLHRSYPIAILRHTIK